MSAPCVVSDLVDSGASVPLLEKEILFPTLLVARRDGLGFLSKLFLFVLTNRQVSQRSNDISAQLFAMSTRW